MFRSLTVRRPLEAFPQIRTRDVDELVTSINRYYGHTSFALPQGSKAFNVIANHRQLHTIGLTYAGHGTPIRLELPAFQHFAQLFAFRGYAEAGAGRVQTEISQDKSFVGSYGETVKLNYAADFEQLVLKIDAATLISKLEAITGSRLSGRLSFDPVSDPRQPGNALLRKMVLFCVETFSSDVVVPAIALAELEQAMMVSFLCGNRHNYSQLFARDPPKPGPWQVQRAEEYIEQNWDQPLTVEALTIVTGASARSIFLSFKQGRGYSPMNFVKNVRLRRANEMLSMPRPETSVTDIAFACGFGNLGHFAHYYRRRFGESPSETLNRAKGGGRIRSS